MSDEGPESLALRYLRSIDQKLDQLRDDFRELKHRVTALEEGLSSVRRELVYIHESQVRIQHALDRQGERIDRIERRLDLLPAA